MYISKIRVKNYKAFRDSVEINFKSGINIIVGQNNSGKTALLESVSGKFSCKPHRNEQSAIFQGNSLVELTVSIEAQELNKLKGNPEFKTIIIPQPLDGRIEEAENTFNNCFDSKLDIKIRIYDGNLDVSSLSHELYEERTVDTNNKNMALHLSDITNRFIARNERDYVVGNANGDTIGFKLITSLYHQIYRFNAERLNLGVCNMGNARDLLTDASNLADVLLNTKANNDVLYERFVRYTSEIIPSVKWITSVPIDGGTRNEIRVWSVSKETERDDLAIPLSECGTGIGQVLAILYVVVTSKEPRTIIIDEPNSFLHPGAAKKLIQILNKFPQHQYFISTHSAEILSAAKPSTITRLRYVDGETIAESINPEQTKDLRETLDEIGVRFSDVFFSENILWVEGETEEKAFPMILETADELLDVAILPLVHTDDLKQRKSIGQKHAKLVFKIYERLSGANALTPPFVAVILDKESSSQAELDELTKTFGDKLKFLPRMMYENYLLDAEAITSILNDEIIEGENKVSAEQVEQLLTEKREARFLAKNQVSEKVLKINDWLEKVHAANLIEEMFSELSGKTVEYRKTTHSVKLTKWLLENKTEQLSELKDFLLKILSA